MLRLVPRQIWRAARKVLRSFTLRVDLSLVDTYHLDFDPGTLMLCVPSLPPDIICQIIQSAQPSVATPLPWLSPDHLRFRRERITLIRNFSRVNKAWRAFAQEEFSRWIWVTLGQGVETGPLAIIPEVHLQSFHHVMPKLTFRIEARDSASLEVLQKNMAISENLRYTWTSNPDFYQLFKFPKSPSKLSAGKTVLVLMED